MQTQIMRCRTSRNLAFFMRDYEYWDNRVLNELYSSMNSSMYLLRHFDVDRSTDSEENNLFRENRRNKKLRNKKVSTLIRYAPSTEWLIDCRCLPLRPLCNSVHLG